jgi:hypothetical protein
MILVLVLFSPAAFVLLGWATEAYHDTGTSSEVSHRLHEVVFGILFSLALVGAITQLLSPKRNLAGLIQVTVTLVTLAIVVTATVNWQIGLLLYLLPLAGLLVFAAPAKPFRSGPIWWWAMALVLMALGPMRVEIEGHIDRAISGAQNHTTHWSAMATFALVLLLLGGVVALRVTGYRIVAMSVAGAAAIYGLASLIFPYDASSHTAGYAIMLILWAAAWLLGLAFLDRPPKEVPRSLPIRVVKRGLLVVGLFFSFAIVAALWIGLDEPPNVPHSPNPNQPILEAADVDRATCLECHQTGISAAPASPHPARVCEDQPCWGGRIDCAGCHRLDPELGGPLEQLEVQAWDPYALAGPSERAIVPLDTADIARIKAIGLSE